MSNLGFFWSGGKKESSKKLEKKTIFVFLYNFCSRRHWREEEKMHLQNMCVCIFHFVRDSLCHSESRIDSELREKRREDEKKHDDDDWEGKAIENKCCLASSHITTYDY